MRLMSLAEHQAATDETTRYPGAGTGTMPALMYLALGLAGESSEVLEKHQADDRPGLAAELGDVLWYVARLHREVGLDVDAAAPVPLPANLTREAAITDLIIAAGRLAEIVKKALTGDAGQLTEQRRTALAEHLPHVSAAWNAVAAAYWLNPMVIAGANIDKLLDRRDRNVIAGSGDNR